MVPRFLGSTHPVNVEISTFRAGTKAELGRNYWFQNGTSTHENGEKREMNEKKKPTRAQMKKQAERFREDRINGLSIEEIAKKHNTRAEVVARYLEDIHFEKWTKLYIKTTADKYELPVAVSEDAQTLAEMLGLHKTSVLSMITREVPTYHRIWVKEGEEDDEL